MRRALLLLVSSGLLLVLAACGPMPGPTPTPIALQATATVMPRPTRTPTPTAPGRLEAVPPVATHTPSSPSQVAAGLSDLNDRLVQRTVADFAARLAAGNADSAFRLYLTEQARQAGTSLPEQLVGVTEASVQDVQRTQNAGYRARLVLHRADQDGASASAQEMVLDLVRERGVWRISAIALGELQAAATLSARLPAATLAATRRPQGLTGRVVFQVSSGGAIYLVNADGSGLQRLTDGLDPAWSPDGTRIAFSRWREPWGIYVLRPEESGVEERVVDGNLLKEVAWSADGRRLAFTINYSSPAGQKICFFGYCFTLPPYSVGQMWIADLDTGEFLSLPLDDKAVHAPAWDPTRDRIVYAGDRGLAWIDLGGQEDEITTGRFEGGSAWDTSPSFSPDGKKIAYMTRVHDRWEIWAMNADGSGRTQLTHMNQDLEQKPSNVAPVWSPGSTGASQIAFLSNRDGPWRIYVMNADGSQQRPMFGDKLDSLGIRYEWATERVLSWAP